MKNSTIHCAKNRIALFEQSLRVEVLESQGLTEPNWPIQSWAFSQNIYSGVLFQSVGLPERKPAPKSCLRAPDAETVRWVSLVRKEEGSIKTAHSVHASLECLCDLNHVYQQTANGLQALS